MLALPICGLVALLAAELDVRGQAKCPSPAEVAERIPPLLAPQRGFDPGLVLFVEERVDSAEIEVRLENESESLPVATRRLPRRGSCGELAEAVAVVAASWAGHYETPLPSRLPSWEAAPDLAVRDRPRPAVSPARVWSLGGGAGLAAARDGGLALDGGLELTLPWRDTRWFGRLRLAATGERTLSVGAGSANWWRFIVMPSVGRIWGDSAYFEVSGGPVVGPVFVRGDGFAPNAGDAALDVGLAPAARVGYQVTGPVPTRVWIGLSATVWLRPHRVVIDASLDDASIPTFDMTAGVGASFAFGR